MSPDCQAPLHQQAELIHGFSGTWDCPDFFIFASGMAVKCFFSVMLICTSLKSDAVENFFLHVLTVHVYSSVSCLFILLPIFP